MSTNTEGYAAGVLIPEDSPWLTVVGSAYRSDLVYPTREMAEARAAEITGPARPDVVVRYVRAEFCGAVTVSNTAYRIIEDPEEAEIRAECKFWEAHYTD